MTRFIEPHADEATGDDAFLNRLREAPRPEFAAALYARIAGAEAGVPVYDAPLPLFPASDAAPTTVAPGGGMRGRAAWLPHLRTFGAVAVVLIVVAVASLALLRSPFTPVASQPTIAPVASGADLLYPGTLDGRTGIIIVPADGGQARVLVEGPYYGALTAPDGRQFLAYGQADDVFRSALVKLYDRSGQLLRRYDLGYTTPLTGYWSPDGSHLALFARDGDKYQTWLLAEDGAQELRFGVQNYLGTPAGMGAWSVQGRFFVSSAPDDSNGDGRIDGIDRTIVWSVDANGGDRRRLFEGNAMNLGWSGTGEEIYLLEAGRLIAIDAATGQQRVIATAEEIGRQVTPAAPADVAGLSRATFDHGRAWALVVGPEGDRIGLWLTPAAPIGTPSPPAPYLVVVDQRGRVVAQERAVPGREPLFASWAGDAGHLAYAFGDGGNGVGGIRVVGVAGGVSVSADFAGGVGIDAWMTSLRWSPNGRRLAYLLNGRIVVADVASGGVETLPGASRGWPSWLGGVR